MTSPAPASTAASPPVYVGLMSGTSLDGVDAVAVEFPPLAPRASLQALAHVHQPFDEALRSDLLALNAAGADELHRAAVAANGVAQAYARAVSALLATPGLAGRRVQAIGAHGQTVRHRPEAGYTVQLLNGALLAELTGLDVVCDFRSRDVAAGGQGAPLVPAFHAGLFRQAEGAVHDLAVLNLGGIANLTLLPRPPGAVGGFDCGPGNALLDAWCEAHTGARFDDGGRWAAGGTVIAPLLQAMLEEPYFGLPLPKSTGRDLFHRPWLERALQRVPGSAARAQDVQATLAELTATAAAQALKAHLPEVGQVLACGGGARNADLLTRLRALLKAEGINATVQPTSERGIPVDQVEAMAFAWLAHAFFASAPGNLPSVTGARGPRVLGAWYPAG